MCMSPAWPPGRPRRQWVSRPVVTFGMAQTGGCLCGQITYELSGDLDRDRGVSLRPLPAPERWRVLGQPHRAREPDRRVRHAQHVRGSWRERRRGVRACAASAVTAARRSYSALVEPAGVIAVKVGHARRPFRRGADRGSVVRTQAAVGATPRHGDIARSRVTSRRTVDAARAGYRSRLRWRWPRCRSRDAAPEPRPTTTPARSTRRRSRRRRRAPLSRHSSRPSCSATRPASEAVGPNADPTILVPALAAVAAEFPDTERISDLYFDDENVWMTIVDPESPSRSRSIYWSDYHGLSGRRGRVHGGGHQLSHLGRPRRCDHGARRRAGRALPDPGDRHAAARAPSSPTTSACRGEWISSTRAATWRSCSPTSTAPSPWSTRIGTDVRDDPSAPGDHPGPRPRAASASGVAARRPTRRSLLPAARRPRRHHVDRHRVTRRPAVGHDRVRPRRRPGARERHQAAERRPLRRRPTAIRSRRRRVATASVESSDVLTVTYERVGAVTRYSDGVIVDFAGIDSSDNALFPCARCYLGVEGYGNTSITGALFADDLTDARIALSGVDQLRTGRRRRRAAIRRGGTGRRRRRDDRLAPRRRRAGGTDRIGRARRRAGRDRGARCGTRRVRPRTNRCVRRPADPPIGRIAAAVILTAMWALLVVWIIRRIVSAQPRARRRPARGADRSRCAPSRRRAASSRPWSASSSATAGPGERSAVAATLLALAHRGRDRDRRRSTSERYTLTIPAGAHGTTPFEEATLAELRPQGQVTATATLTGPPLWGSRRQRRSLGDSTRIAVKRGQAGRAGAGDVDGVGADPGIVGDGHRRADRVGRQLVARVAGHLRRDRCSPWWHRADGNEPHRRRDAPSATNGSSTATGCARTRSFARVGAPGVATWGEPLVYATVLGAAPTAAQRARDRRSPPSADFPMFLAVQQCGDGSDQDASDRDGRDHVPRLGARANDAAPRARPAFPVRACHRPAGSDVGTVDGRLRQPAVHEHDGNQRVVRRRVLATEERPHHLRDPRRATQRPTRCSSSSGRTRRVVVACT